MFQQSDKNFDFQQSYNLNVCQYEYLSQDNYESMDFLEKHRTTSDDNNSQNYVKVNQQPQKSPKIEQKVHSLRRKTNQIEIDMKKCISVFDCKKGERLQTLNMSRNVKTQTSNFLKILVVTRQTSNLENQAIQYYNSQNGCLQSYINLFSFGKLRIKCLQFYSSHNFIRRIFSSCKMQFQNKLLLIKFLEKIRLNTIKPLKGWKHKTNQILI